MIAAWLLMSVPEKGVIDALLAGPTLAWDCGVALVISALLAISWPLRAWLSRSNRGHGGDKMKRVKAWPPPPDAVPSTIVDEPSIRATIPPGPIRVRIGPEEIPSEMIWKVSRR